MAIALPVAINDHVWELIGELGRELGIHAHEIAVFGLPAMLLAVGIALFVHWTNT